MKRLTQTDEPKKLLITLHTYTEQQVQHFETQWKNDKPQEKETPQHIRSSKELMTEYTVRVTRRVFSLPHHHRRSPRPLPLCAEQRVKAGRAPRHRTSEAASLFKLESGGEESFHSRDSVA